MARMKNHIDASTRYHCLAKTEIGDYKWLFQIILENVGSIEIVWYTFLLS